MRVCIEIAGKFLFVASICAISSCKVSESTKMTNRAPNVHIVVKNVGKTKLTNSSVTFGDRIARPGILTPGQEATHMFFNHPLTEFAIVDFETAGGTSVRRTVDMKSALPTEASEHLTLIFEIDGDRGKVTVRATPGL